MNSVKFYTYLLRFNIKSDFITKLSTKFSSMRKILSCLLALVLLGSVVKAQMRTVKGRVTDAGDGSPLPGVSVRVKGTTVGTQTGGNGQFSVQVPRAGGVLVISFIGYSAKEVAVGARNEVNVALAADTRQLNEVLVVAYGTASKRTYTGSIAQIKSEDFEKRPITNVMSSLVGVAPGVQTSLAGGAPGSTPEIRLRGFGSISSSNSPLIVVDGVVYNGDLSNLDPADVESMSVLKDGATAALYGSRASNGVIQITTKKGRANQSTLQVRASKGWVSRGLPEYERVDAYQYYPLMWEAQRNSLHYGSAAIPLDVAASIASGLTTRYNNTNYSGIKSLLGYNPFNVGDNEIVDVNGNLNPNAQLLYPDDLDWADQAAQGGKQRENYSMSYSGGSEKSDYFGSLGYTNEEGYLIKSKLQRFTGRLNVNTQPLSWFKTGLNINGAYSKNNPDNAGSGGTSYINPFYISRFIGPIYPVHLHDATGAVVLDENGQPQYDFGANRPYASGRHAIYENLMDSQYQVRGVLGARTYATINILPELKFTTNASFDLQDTHLRNYDNPNIGDGAPSGRAYQYLYRTTNYTFNQLLEYTKKFGKHNLNVLAGHENYSYKYNNFSGSRSGMIVEGITELANFATVLGVSSYENNATVESYLSRLNYDYDQKYLFSASFRRDGNSKFSPDVRWANFWSLGAGWNIDKESFFQLPWVDQLKLRASYAEMGNDKVLDDDGNLLYYPYQSLYTLGRNNQSSPGVTRISLPNDQLTWETGKVFDAAVDFSILKGRLTGTVEYFDRKTDGLIFSIPQPLSAGGTYDNGNYVIPSNIGNLYNRGGELQLTGQIVKSNGFNYSATLNLSKFTNKVTKMPATSSLIQEGTKAISEGHSIYDFYLRKFYGVDPDNGAALYYTNNLTSNARVIGRDTVTTVLGEANYRYTGDSAIPDVYGSMSHNFSYKNLSLIVQFTFQLGGKVYDSAYGSLMHGGNYGTALHVDELKRWQKPGDVTDVPRLDNAQQSNFAGASTRWLTDASYLQLNMVTLNYALPKKWLSTIKAGGANIFVSGENLALFSKRKGMNVSGSFNGTVDNTYNFSRIMSLGVNVNF